MIFPIQANAIVQRMPRSIFIQAWASVSLNNPGMPPRTTAANVTCERLRK